MTEINKLPILFIGMEPIGGVKELKDLINSGEINSKLENHSVKIEDHFRNREWSYYVTICEEMISSPRKSNEVFISDVSLHSEDRSLCNDRILSGLFILVAIIKLNY